MAGVKKIKARKIRKNVEIVDNDSEKVENVIEESIVNKKKVKSRKIHMSLSNAEEKKLDREIEKEDNFSVALMVTILGLCFIVGITLGYVLYKIAINGAI